LKRALAPNKPFVLGGRGYRDALIWFSLLELAQSCVHKISFISDNTKDWCREGKSPELHVDLLEDLRVQGIDCSRVQMFLSLGEFTQQCTIDSLPESALATESKAQPPDYRQLLVDGRESIETELVGLLPDFLHEVSRAGARADDVEIAALAGPTDILSLPVRA